MRTGLSWILTGVAALFSTASTASTPSMTLAAPNTGAAKAPLLLSEVLRSVDTQYPLVHAAREDLHRAQADRFGAQGGFDPLLKFGYQATPIGEYENRYLDLSLEQPTPYWGARLLTGYRNGGGKFAPYDGRLDTNASGEVRAGIELPVLRGRATDERRARLLSTEANADAAEQSLKLQLLDARRSASLRYYDWLAASARLEVAHSLTVLAVQRDRILSQRVRHGDAARIEADDNVRTVIQREASEVAARRALDRAGLELGIFFRNEKGEPSPPSADSCPTDWEAPLPPVREPSLDALSNHPELGRLRAQLQANDADTSLADNSILPKLDLELLAAKDFGEGSPARGQTEAKAAIKLEWPLWARAGRGRSRAAVAAGHRIESQLTLSADRLRMQLEDYRRAMAAALERFGAAQREIELALTVERAERVRIFHDESNVLQVNLREQATADARGRLIDARFDYLRAQAELVAAAGEASGDR